jgi:SpoVK/Ycf46/Vps4 family AAA+-type ATPase
MVSLATAATVSLGKIVYKKVNDRYTIEFCKLASRYGFNFTYDWIFKNTHKFDTLKCTCDNGKTYFLPDGKYSFNVYKFTRMEFEVCEIMCNNNKDTMSALKCKLTGINSRKYMKEIQDNITVGCRKGKIKSTEFNGLLDLPTKTFDDIVTPSKEKNKDYLDMWISNKDYYRRHNISYKGGIVLYGPKGGGKTSLIQAIANYLEYSVVITTPITISNLRNMGSIEKCVIVLEDIDCYVGRRDESITDDNKETMNVIGDILNVLDGIASINDVIFIATTNYIDRVDDAVTRSGRFDLKVEVPLLEREYAIELIEKLEAKPEDILPKLSLPATPSDIQAEVLNQLKHM